MVVEALSVVGYVRVSTDEQARDGVSLEAQTIKIRSYCELYGLRLVCVLCDGGESGKNLDRPALAEALGMLDQGLAGGLVVAKLDRLTRSVKDLGGLLEGYFDESKPHQLFSVAEAIDTRKSAGRLVLNVLMSVAQWERETIVERTRDAISHKRSKGERIGTVPYGWSVGKDGKTLFRNEQEQEVLWYMRQLRTMGFSFREIATRLDAMGHATKLGKGPWSPSTVCALLSRSYRESDTVAR